jgi:hypothetical protein
LKTVTLSLAEISLNSRANFVEDVDPEVWKRRTVGDLLKITWNNFGWNGVMIHSLMFLLTKAGSSSVRSSTLQGRLDEDEEDISLLIQSVDVY